MVAAQGKFRSRRELCERKQPVPAYSTVLHVGFAAPRPPAAVAMETEAESAVLVEVEHGPSNSRRLYAGVNIAAPWTAVWAALTDYDGLDSFIPGKQIKGRPTILDYSWKNLFQARSIPRLQGSRQLNEECNLVKDVNVTLYD